MRASKPKTSGGRPKTSGANSQALLTCSAWDDAGRGLVSWQGQEIGVSGLIPGEQAALEWRRGAGGRLVEGYVKRLATSSPLRQKPPCPYYGPCGACQIQHLSSEGQRAFKQAISEKHLGAFGPVAPIVTMDNPWHYRNKAHITFGEKHRGQVISGLYQEGSHRLVAIDTCLVQTARANAVAATVRALMPGFKLSPFNEDTGRGLLRHVLVREGFATGDLMVVLVLAESRMPSKRNFVQALLKKHPEITTILINVNGERTSMVLGKHFETLYGPGFIRETTAKRTFEIAPNAFYQINPVQTERLYKLAVEACGLKGDDLVVDAYCGVGTIGMIASDKAKRVIGVESNRDSVAAAKRNLELNGITNMQVYCQDAGDWMQQQASLGKVIDVLFMDPPRAGADDKFLTSVLALRPQKIVYVSCNIETQKRDVKRLVDNDYYVSWIQPIDLFPHSFHIESIVVLEKKVTKSYKK